MGLENLKPAKGSIKSKTRVGRGEGSGKGGTSARGHKGAQSRSGYSKKRGFEGGQMPLQRRIPKRGFKNPGRVEYFVINLSKAQELIEKYEIKSFDMETLHQHKLISKTDRVKILGHGEIKAKADFKVHAVSATAKEAIEKAGGSITLI